MEQKQLEDLDESYFGEEFIDDDQLERSRLGSNLDDDIKIEAVESKTKLRRKPAFKKSRLPGTENQADSAGSAVAGNLSSLTSDLPSAAGSAMELNSKKGRDKLEQPTAKPSIPPVAAAKPRTEASLANSAVSSTDRIVNSADRSANSKVINNLGPAGAEKNISGSNAASVKSVGGESSARGELNLETKSRIDPFKPEKNPRDAKNGPLAEVSTWKAITGIVIILLVFSVFTQGFHFTGEASTGAAAAEKEISSEEAEWRVLRYVNGQLLEPPFLATSEGASEAGPLYQIMLNIAGEKVVSYVTKDGRLFFPQGIDISFFLAVEEVEEDTSQLEDAAVDAQPGITIAEPEEKEENIDAEAAEVTSGVSDSKTNSISLTAKKWLFSPHQLVVKEGQMVALMIKPENLDFTFALPELGIEKEVTGPTTVEFTPTRTGSFAFTCSSCEEWRGMSGVLIVE